MLQFLICGGCIATFETAVDRAVLIGRGDSCDLRIQDPCASRVHCRIVDQNGRVVLYDAGSRWGTYVNGRRISTCELHPGDDINIGETTLRLTSSGAYVQHV